MRPSAALVLVLLVGCGEDPPPAPTPAEPVAEPEPVEAAPAPVPEPPPVAPVVPVTPPPTRAELDAARAQCNEGYAALGRGDLYAADMQIRPALVVLRRATEPDDREALGACLYNAGRWFEESLIVGAAREHYDESLEVRPNPIVARRRRELGERETSPPDDRWDMVPHQLARAEGHPCPTPRSCTVEAVQMAHSGGGRLLRAAIVSVATEADLAEGDGRQRLFLTFTGPRGAFRWGPQLWPFDRDFPIQIDDPTPFMAFRHAIPDHPWLLFARISAVWREDCCGGSESGSDEDLAVCDLTDEAARCFLVAELRECEGERTDPEDADYVPCHHRRVNRARFDDAGLTVEGEGPANATIGPSGYLGPGTYPWTTLFPPPAEPAAEVPAAPTP